MTALGRCCRKTQRRPARGQQSNPGAAFFESMLCATRRHRRQKSWKGCRFAKPRRSPSRRIPTPKPSRARAHRKTWIEFCASLLARRWGRFGSGHESAGPVFVARSGSLPWPYPQSASDKARGSSIGWGTRCDACDPSGFWPNIAATYERA